MPPDTPPDISPDISPQPRHRVLALDLDPIADGIADRGDTLVTRAQSRDLDAALLARLNPERIVMPLFSGAADAQSLVERLVELGYAGDITVIGPVLPNPGMVERELRGLGPGHRLRLLTP